MFKDFQPNCVISLRKNVDKGQRLPRLNDNWTYIKDSVKRRTFMVTFQRHHLDGYFKWIQDNAIGLIKLRAILSQAHTRSIMRVYSPGGKKEESLKRRWQEMVEEQSKEEE